MHSQLVKQLGAVTGASVLAVIIWTCIYHISEGERWKQAKVKRWNNVRPLLPNSETLTKTAIDVETGIIRDKASQFIADQTSVYASNKGKKSSFECRCIKHNQPVCKFHNVCYDTKQDSLLFYGDGCDKIPKTINTLSANGKRAKNLNVQCKEGDVTGTVHKGPFALIREFYRANPGHTMGDEVWPIFQAMRLFGLHNSTDMQTLSFSNFNRKALEQYKALSSREPLLIGDFAAKAGTDQPCFDTVLVGWARLGFFFGHNPVWEYNEYSHIGFRSYCLPPFKRTFWEFRQHLLKTMQVKEEKLMPHKPLVRFLTKRQRADHQVVIHNLQDIVDKFKTRNPDVRVEVTDFAEVNTLKEQAKMMTQTDLVVSIGGASLINGVFLPVGAELIEICSWVKGMRNPDFLAETKSWLSYSHVKLQHVCYPEKWLNHNPVWSYDVLINYIRLALRRRNLSGGRLLYQSIT